jgi:hypothetical protein
MLKFTCTTETRKTGPTKKGGVWRQQGMLAHQANGEVTLLTWFLRDNEQHLEAGEYELTPNALRPMEMSRVDKRTGQIRSETGLGVWMGNDSFRKVGAAAVSPAKVAGIRS